MPPKTYTVRHSPDLDWSRAEVLEDFTFPWREYGAPLTRLRALHDGERFHFHYQTVDDDVVLDPSEDPAQAVLGSDRVELFFSPTSDLSQPYYGLEMDPRGGVYDYEGRFHRQFDPGWTMPGLEVQGELTDDGYEVRGSLALSTLRDLGCLRGGEMITGAYRAEFHRGDSGEIVEDWIAWVDPRIEDVDFHVPSSFGRFLFEE